MQTALIPIRDRNAWQHALAGLPHAFAHSWEYNDALCRTPQYANICLWSFERNGVKAACPLIERKWQGVADVVTPYGFSGLVANANPSDILPAWHATARQQGWICGYLGLHPVLARQDFSESECFSANQVYALDLSLSRETLASRFSDNLQTRLQQWERGGAQLTRDRELCRRFFCTTYPAFLQRVQAGAAYAFSTGTLSALFDHPQVFAVGAYGANGLEAVSMFGYARECGEYLFNVSTEAGRHHSARLLREGIFEMQQRGALRMNLGGGIAPNDGLAAFKARFGGECLPLRALKQVYDEVTYQRCCAAVGADAQSRAGYFPAYRQLATQAARA